MREFKGLKCPRCGKKGLKYADHPHTYGWKDYDRVKCRYCEARFPTDKIEALEKEVRALPEPAQAPK